MSINNWRKNCQAQEMTNEAWCCLGKLPQRLLLHKVLRNRKVTRGRDSLEQRRCGEEASRQTRHKEVKHNISVLIKMSS